MPSRRWDEPWAHYPPSVPLPAEGGLVTSKQRGAMAATWWSRRFTEVLESYGLGARMQRGRRYARTGQVLNLDVSAAVLTSQVQGSRRTPYHVTVSLPEPTAAQWGAIVEAMAAKVGFVAHLLSGEVPEDLETIFASAGVTLFPRAWGDLGAKCSCPDWENPCKHIAAVLYVFADQLDSDPWLILSWRGRTREQLLEPFLGREAEGDPVNDEVAPWWPFAPGPLPPLPTPTGGAADDLDVPALPDAVLEALAPLEIEIRGAPFVERLRPLYEAIVASDSAEVE